MAKEIERKFLVDGDGWRPLADAGTALKQFYLWSDNERTVRVRISPQGAQLTLKFGGARLSRDEFEYAVPMAEAEALAVFAVGQPIEKTRYRLAHRGRTFEVDVFGGALSGLVMAELETPDDVADGELPPWLGREVTGNTAFYNASMALQGAPWGAACV